MVYAETPVYELLTQASRGRIGVDQRLIRSIVDRGDAAVHDLLKFGLEDHSEDPVGLEIDGPEGSDQQLLAIGLALETILPELPAPKI